MGGGARQSVDVAALTGVRALAAWWVVAYHTRNLFVPWASPEVVRLLAAGDLAVDLFFVLSGFVIYLNYAGRLEPSRTSIADFIMRRIARIYPLHLLLLLATIAYVIVLRVGAGKPLTDAYPPSLIPFHLLLMQGWGLVGRIGWNVPSWSISTELLAYSAFPLVALLLAWQRRPTWLLIVIAGASLIALHAFIRANGFTTLGQDIPRAGLARCLTQFLAGTIVCELYLRFRAHAAVMGPAAMAAAALLVAAHVWLGWAESWTMPFAWAALVAGLAMWPWPLPGLLTSRPIVYLGEISYSTYLVHVLAYTVFKLVAVPDRSAVGPGMTLIYFAIVLALSILLYHGFERPAQRWLIDRWQRKSLRNRPT